MSIGLRNSEYFFTLYRTRYRFLEISFEKRNTTIFFYVIFRENVDFEVSPGKFCILSDGGADGDHGDSEITY